MPAPRSGSPFWTPALRAIDQLGDRVFLGVVMHSVVWSAVAFAALAGGIFYGGHAILSNQGWLGWLAGAAGAVGTLILSLWLFLPLATVIASLFVERIAASVEQRWYPAVLPGRPASLMAQAQDGVILGLRVLLMQAIALVATLIPPHVTGLAIGWLIASWAVGRGLFVPVAMLRMDRPAALALYRKLRIPVIFQGGLLTAAGLVPVLNLLAPVLGVAAMVHLLHWALGSERDIPARVVPSSVGVLGNSGQRSVS
jgi:CysZ protein